MPTVIKITQPVGSVIVSPQVRWPNNSRLSEGDKAAMDAYTKEIEKTVRRLTEAVRDLQTQLEGKTV